MNRLRDIFTVPVLSINAGTVLYFVGILTGISLGFWAGRV